MSLLNLTEIENDPLLDINPQEAIEEFESLPLNWYWIITNTIKLFFCLGLIVADSFMIFTMCRNKKLKTKTNSYILNYFIFSLVYMLFPIFWFLFEVTPMISLLGVGFWCVIYHLEGCNVFFSHLFSFGLALDWLLMVHKPHLGQRYQKLYSYSIHFIYLIGILYTILMCSICSNPYRIVSGFLEIVYPSVLIFVLVCNYLRYKNKTLADDKTSISLIISSIMTFSWTPLYIFDSLLDWTLGHKIITDILLFTFFIPEWLIYLCPIVIIVVLGRRNKYFQMAYDRTLKRSVRNYDGDEESLEESEERRPVEDVTTNITPI